MPFIIQNFPLVAAGGVPPYTWQTIDDAENTFVSAGGVDSIQIISGVPNLHLDATGVPTPIYPGVYQTHVRVTDSATPTPNTADSLIKVVVGDPTLLVILNNDQDFLPASFPASFSIPLNANGGTAPYTWSLIESATTLPNPTITGTSPNFVLNFTLSNYGEYTAGLNVVDSVGNSVSTVVLYTIVNPTLFALVDGQIEVSINVPATNIGTHHFTATIQDSSVPANNATGTFYYTAYETYSEVLLPEAFFDHYWGGPDDTTAIVFPIIGLDNLQGYALGSPTITQPSNGLVVTVDNVNDVVKVAGPPTAFQSSEVRIPFQIVFGSTQVALISREYTLLAHSDPDDIGTATVYPRPYIVGDFVGLNPQKPWFNSPSIQKNVNYTARVQTGSSLPAGLSLDANTSLIYGNLAGTKVPQSVIEYVDSSNLVHGTITIIWSTYNSDFVLINNLTTAQVQQAYSATISSNSASKLTTVTIVEGVLPQGLSATIDVAGQNVVISGTPLEAGYFDIWFAVTNSTGQTAYLYTRFTSDFILPLTVLTSSLPAVSAQPYSYELQGFGGVQPYVWSLDPSSPSLPAGLTLSSGGVISGTVGGSFSPINLVVDLTDSSSPALSTQAVLTLTYNNALTVTTPAIPIVVPGQPYSFQMTAQGGVPPYTWSITPTVDGLAFPTGISFNTSGVFSGVTDEVSGSEPVTITVTDSASANANKVYTLQIGSPSGLIIDTADVGPINRGTPYQGHLSVSGPGTAPYAWQIPPSSPNPLPSGLVLTPDASTSGVTATISGTYSGAVLTNYPVEVEVIDANGQSAFAYMLMSTSSNVIITNPSLPVGETSASYSVQLLGSGGVPPYTFSLDVNSPALPSGFTLSGAGLLSGTTPAAYKQNVIFDIADSLTPANTGKKTFTLQIQATNLTITTASLPTLTAGVAYSAQLQATETPVYSPWTWSISPSSAATLPPGITLNSSTGAITGTTQIVGARSVTFRVTDALGGFAEKTFSLGIATGLALRSGIAYTAGYNFWAGATPYTTGTIIVDGNGNLQQCTTPGTSGNTPPNPWNTSGTTTDNTVTWTFFGRQYLGYIDNGNVAALNTRPNDSFYVIATSVVSTSPAQIQVNVGSPDIGGITANVLSITTGTALIQLTGPFGNAPAGDHALTITITDNGVQVSTTLYWNVYSSGSIRLAPGSGTFPVQIIGA